MISNILLVHRIQHYKIIECILLSLEKCLQVYNQSEQTINSCALVFKTIIELTIYPYEYYHQLITLFLSFTPISSTFIESLCILIKQKPSTKPLLSKNKLLLYLSSQLQTKQSYTFISIISFFIEVTQMINDDFFVSHSMIFTPQIMQQLVFNFKESLFSYDRNEKAIQLLLLLFSNLTEHFTSYQQYFIEIIELLLIKKYDFSVKELEYVIYFLNEIILHADDIFKISLCSSQIFEFYSHLLERSNLQNDYLVQILSRIKDVIIIGLNKGYDINKLLNESSLLSSFMKLELHFCKQVSQIILSIQHVLYSSSVSNNSFFSDGCLMDCYDF